jgi:phage-related protein
MSLNADYQKLEPGNEVRLFSVDGTAFGMSDVLFFHAHNIAHTPEEIDAAGGDESKLPAKSIWWQGQEYKPGLPDWGLRFPPVGAARSLNYRLLTSTAL